MAKVLGWITLLSPTGFSGACLDSPVAEGDGFVGSVCWRGEAHEVRRIILLPPANRRLESRRCRKGKLLPPEN